MHNPIQHDSMPRPPAKPMTYWDTQGQSAGATSDQGKAPLVGTGSMVGPRPSRAEVREAVLQGRKVAAALRALAEEEGITFLELLRRIAELPDERQPRSNP